MSRIIARQNFRKFCWSVPLFWVLTQVSVAANCSGEINRAEKLWTIGYEREVVEKIEKLILSKGAECRDAGYRFLIPKCNELSDDGDFTFCAQKLVSAAGTTSRLDSDAASVLQRYADIAITNKSHELAESLLQEILAFEFLSTGGGSEMDISRSNTQLKLGLIDKAREEYGLAKIHFTNSVTEISNTGLGDTFLALGPLLELGNLLVALEDYSTAEEILKRATSVAETSWGTCSVAHVTALRAFRSLLSKTGRLEESTDASEQSMCME